MKNTQKLKGPRDFSEKEGDGGAAVLAPAATLLLNAATRRMLMLQYRALGKGNSASSVVVRGLALKPIQVFLLLYHHAAVLGPDLVP